MTTDPRELAQEVLRLDEQATPGPWLASSDQEPMRVVASMNAAPAYRQPGQTWIAGHEAGGRSITLNEVNARLIAAYRTAAPSLATALLAALEDQERARRILEDRDASLSAEEYEQRAADDAALLASPKAGEILGVLEREALYERHLRWRTLAQVERLRHERDEARAALRRATEPMPDDLLGVRLVNGCASLPDDTPAWVVLLLREAWAAIRVLRADGVTKAAQVASRDEEVERLRAANEELRLTLAAERGQAEGAPHPDWRYDAGTWERYYDDGDSAIVYSDGTWARGPFGECARHKGRAPNRRAAMIAADAALSGEATTSPSALAPQGSQTPR